MPDINREKLHELLTEALERWNIDEEIGSSEGLRQWINHFLKETDILCN